MKHIEKIVIIMAVIALLLVADYVSGQPVTGSFVALVIRILENDSTNENNAIPFIADGDTDGGTVRLEMDSDFTYNPSTGTATAGEFKGGGSNLTDIRGTDGAFGTSWDGDTHAPEKDDVYDVMREQRFSVKDHGATGDGTTDDSTAIQAACTAAGGGDGTSQGIVFIPEGVYHCDSSITVPGRVSMKGVGYGSILKPDLDGSTDFLIQGDQSSSQGCVIWKDFAILADKQTDDGGAVNSCRNAMVITMMHESRYGPITILCDAEEYGLYVIGCIQTYFDINIGTISTSASYARPDNGIYVRNCDNGTADPFTGVVDAGSDTQNNRLEFHLALSGINDTTAGYAMKWDETFGGGTAGGMNSKVIGRIEGNANEYGFYGEGLNTVDFENVYTEAGGTDNNKFYLKTCENINAMNCRFGRGLYIEDSQGITLGPGNEYADIDIESDVFDVHFLGSSKMLASHTYVQIGDSNEIDIDAAGVRSSGIMFFDSLNNRGVSFGGADTINLFTNSTFEDWNSDRPQGWGKDASATWTQCGTGLTDTTNHWDTYSVKYSAQGQTSSYTVPSGVLSMLQGDLATFSIWCKFASGQSPTARSQIQVFRTITSGNESDTMLIYSSEDDTWHRKTVTFHVPTDCTQIDIKIETRGAAGVDGDLYLAEPYLAKGVVAPAGVVNEIDSQTRKWLAENDVGIATTDPNHPLDVDGTVQAEKYLHRTVAVTASADDTDVDDADIVTVDTSGGAVTLGGFANGDAGQLLYVCVVDSTAATTLEHAEGAGSQDVYLSSGDDETVAIGAYGGWLLQYNGSNWYEVTAGGAAGVEDDVYAAGWNGDQTNAPSQNAVYDYLVQFDADADGDFTDEGWFPAGGAVAWDDITNPDADDTIQYTGYEITLSSTLDEAAHTALTLDHTDADLANATTIFGIQGVDNDSANLTFFHIEDDSGGTPDTIFKVDTGVHVGADDEIAHLTVHDAGTIVLYDDSDDTSVTLGPVGDGGTVLGVTGTINATALQVGGSAVYYAGGTDVADADMVDAHSHAADSIDAITEIAAALKSGSDTTLITGTKAANGQLAMFNADGDLVDASKAASAVGSTAYDDIGDPDAAGSISFDAAEGGTYTSSDAEWVGITISNTVADNTGDSELLTLAFTDDGDTNMHYLIMSDAAGTQQLEFIQNTADVQVTSAGDLKFIAGGGDFDFADDNINTTGIATFGRYATFSYQNDTANVSPFIRLNRALAGGADVENDDELGDIRFYGMSNGGYQLGAKIVAVTDGAVGGATDMPSELQFLTSADGSATPTLAMSISAAQVVTFANDLADSEIADDITCTNYLDLATYDSGSDGGVDDVDAEVVALNELSDVTIGSADDCDILVYQATPATAWIDVAMSGDATISNTGVVTVDWTNLTEGELSTGVVVSDDIKDDTIESDDYAAGSIDDEHIADDTIQEPALNVTNAGAEGIDNYVLSYNHAGTNFTWVEMTGGANYVTNDADDTMAGDLTLDDDDVGTALTVRADAANTGASIGLLITTDDDDNANFDPFEIRDDSGSGNDLLFFIDHTGAVTTGEWKGTAIADTYVPDDITIDLASTATVATTVTITDNEDTAENNPLVFVAGGDLDGGDLGLETDGTTYYTPSTGVITATGFAGALTGNVTGDCTGSSGTCTGAADVGTHVTVTDNEDQDEENEVAFVEDASGPGNVGLESDSGFTYNPSTGTLTAAAFAGALTGAVTGNADTCTTASAGDAAVDFFGAGVDAVTDATTCTDIEGTKLSITDGTLNCTETDSVVGAVSGIVKADGGGNISAAVANTDYEPALTDEASLYTTLSDVTQFYEAGDEDSIAAAIAEGELADSIVITDDIKDGTVAAADLNATLDLSSKTITLPVRPKTQEHHMTFNLWNPNAMYDNDTQVCVWPTTPAALTITKITVTCDADPDTELEFDLKWADAFIGLANAAVIDEIDTTSGTTSIAAGFDDADVASGKCIYIEFQADPDSGIKQVCVDVTFDWD